MVDKISKYLTIGVVLLEIMWGRKRAITFLNTSITSDSWCRTFGNHVVKEMC